MDLKEAKEILQKAEVKKQERLKKFDELLKKAMEETDCYLTVDFSSPLDDIRIIAKAKE